MAHTGCENSEERVRFPIFPVQPIGDFISRFLNGLLLSPPNVIYFLYNLFIKE